MVRKRLTRLAALVFAPIVVLSSVHELYLRNQQELDRTLSALYPFWLAAGVAVVLGAFLQRIDRHRVARGALVAYYCSGFGFLAWSFLRALPVADHFPRWVLDLEGGTAAFAAVWLAGTVFLGRRVGARSLEPVVAVLALVLLVREGVLFSQRLDPRPPPPPRDIVAGLGAGGDPSRPNVYHLVLDSFPDDLFEARMPPEGMKAFDGFVRFHARSQTAVTAQAVPLMFAGRPLLGTTPEEQAREGLTGPGSLLPWLRHTGFQTVGFVPRHVYESVPSALDTVVFHNENVAQADVEALHETAFLRLWAFRMLPRGLSERAARSRLFGMPTHLFEREDPDRLSSFAQPVLALLSTERFLAVEPQLPPRGRYTLVHILLPHRPYRLRADCRYGAGSETTDIGEQTECSLRLVVRLLDTLRQLGRLDGSVVVVNGDHGLDEVLRDGQFVEDASAWERTLLLVKAARARGPLRTAEATAHIQDIAPTLRALVGAPPDPTHEGRALGEALGGGTAPRASDAPPSSSLSR